ncbi:ABC transporter substrate-binding protein [Kingella sp. SNUBH-2017]|uniref:ABC transporter substrate-binding protein n=1 Tax=Kingella pumchi TaxID=2779506 RepID=A0ABS9NP34_9NEIS|nr:MULTISPECIES: ABC transporter substrate-binding protein [Kingella]MCG6504549.1 ABC transporter substrate-binding protein [Kingella pumchi]MDD2182650.1 ABC transporter substrate-binding protein [Kingella sp. SNUBH-2017]
MNQAYRIWLALGLGAALAACSGEPAAQKPIQVSNEPAEKQEIVVNNGAEPETLDPHKSSGVPESNILNQLLVGLTGTDPDGKTVPALAEKWESADNQTWVFHLREAQWSNGDPITADDFVYSMRRVVDPLTASPYASYLGDAKVKNAEEIANGKAKPEELGVKALDAKTLQITLSSPVPYFPDMLVHSSTRPVNAKVVEKHGSKWTLPENFVGSGPLRIAEWVVNEKIVLERNDKFFGNADNSISRLTVLPISSPITDVNRFKAGEIDMTYNDLPSDQFKQLKEEMGDQMKISPYLCTYYYEFNHRQAPFDNPKVRRALSLAFDRELFVEKIVGRGEAPAYQLTPTATQGMKDYVPDWKAWDKAKRLEEAKKLLQEAGYSAEKPLKFEILYNTNENHKKNAVAVAALWKENLGFVEAELNNQEWKTYLDGKRNGKFQMARSGWCGDYNEPSAFLNVFKSNNSSNYGRYNSPAYDDLMRRTLAPGVSSEERAELYHKAEAELDKDSASIFAYHYVSARLVKPYLSGYSDRDPLNYWQAKDWKVMKH